VSAHASRTATNDDRPTHTAPQRSSLNAEKNKPAALQQRLDPTAKSSVTAGPGQTLASPTMLVQGSKRPATSPTKPQPERKRLVSSTSREGRSVLSGKPKAKAGGGSREIPDSEDEGLSSDGGLIAPLSQREIPDSEDEGGLSDGDLVASPSRREVPDSEEEGGLSDGDSIVLPSRRVVPDSEDEGTLSDTDLRALPSRVEIPDSKDEGSSPDADSTAVVSRAMQKAPARISEDSGDDIRSSPPQSAPQVSSRLQPISKEEAYRFDVEQYALSLRSPVAPVPSDASAIETPSEPRNEAPLDSLLHFEFNDDTDFEFNDDTDCDSDIAARTKLRAEAASRKAERAAAREAKRVAKNAAARAQRAPRVAARKAERAAAREAKKVARNAARRARYAKQVAPPKAERSATFEATRTARNAAARADYAHPSRKAERAAAREAEPVATREAEPVATREANRVATNAARRARYAKQVAPPKAERSATFEATRIARNAAARAAWPAKAARRAAQWAAQWAELPTSAVEGRLYRLLLHEQKKAGFDQPTMNVAEIEQFVSSHLTDNTFSDDYVVGQDRRNDSQSAFRPSVDAVFPVALHNGYTVAHAPGNLAVTARWANYCKATYLPGVLGLLREAQDVRSLPRDNARCRELLDRFDHQFGLTKMVPRYMKSRLNKAITSQALEKLKQFWVSGIFPKLEVYATILRAKFNATPNNSSTHLDLIIGQMEVAYGKTVLRSPSGAPWPFIAHHMPAIWTWYDILFCFAERLYRMTKDCNRKHETAETVESLLLECIRQYLKYEGREPIFGLEMTIWARHPLSFVIAHDVHGRQMRTGFADPWNIQDFFQDYDEARCNIAFQPQITNFAIHNFPDEDVARIVEEVKSVPTSCKYYSRPDRVPPVNIIFYRSTSRNPKEHELYKEFFGTFDEPDDDSETDDSDRESESDGFEDVSESDDSEDDSEADQLEDYIESDEFNHDTDYENDLMSRREALAAFAAHFDY